MRNMEPQLRQHCWSKKQEKHRAIHPICTRAQGWAFQRSARCRAAPAPSAAGAEAGCERCFSHHHCCTARACLWNRATALHTALLAGRRWKWKITPPHYWKTPWHHCGKGARGIDHSRQKFAEGFGGSSESADEQLQLKHKFPQGGIPQMVPSRPKEIPFPEVWKYSSFMKPSANHKNTLKNVNIAAFAIKGELYSFVFHFSLTTAYPTSKSAHCILGMSINKQFPVKHGKGRSFTAFSLKRAAASESLLQIQLCIFTCVLLPNPFSSSLHHNINSK